MQRSPCARRTATRFGAIDRDEQCVAERAGGLKVTDVAHVKQIETPICENEFRSALTHRDRDRARLFRGDDFLLHPFGAMKRNARGTISKRAGSFPTSSPSTLNHIPGFEFTVNFAARRNTIVLLERRVPSAICAIAMASSGAGRFGISTTSSNPSSISASR